MTINLNYTKQTNKQIIHSYIREKKNTEKQISSTNDYLLTI